MLKFRYSHPLYACLFLAQLLVLQADLSKAQPIPKTKPQEEKIRSVIQQQLDAFNREDYDAAYRFASRHIQSKFSRSEFELMVKGGYPQIAKSRRAVIGAISFSDEDHAAATVTITGQDQVTITASYRMVREGGEWKIDGVVKIEEQTPVSYSRNAGQRPFICPRTPLNANL